MNLQSGPNPALSLTRLRLAATEREAAPTPEHLRAARRAVAQENHASRLLGPDDARWLLACDVQGSIEGGRAAIIRPEVRRRLVSKATGEGLRPFDANLVIAIVQDAARRGEELEKAPVRRLALVGEAEVGRLKPLSLLALAVAIGAVICVALVAWAGSVL